MQTPEYSIKVFTDINDKTLKNAWEDLYEEGNTFIQSSYSWISSWWNVKYKNKKVYIITVIENDNIIGIAPFFIKKDFFIFKCLHSLPIHFGDFTTYITKKKKRKEIISYINNNINNSSLWDFCKFDNININDYLYKDLMLKSFSKKLASTISTLNLEDTFEKHLQSLGKGTRKQIKRNYSKISNEKNYQFKAIYSFEEYMLYFEEMKKLYIERWGKDINSDAYIYRNLVLEKYFKTKDVVLFLILIDNRIISYNLGFLFNNCFYSFKQSFSNNYTKYSPGALMRSYLVPEYLISQNIFKINYMTGDYEYKRTLTRNSVEENENSQFFFSNSLLGKIPSLYYLKYRDLIKKTYKTLLKK